MKVNKTKVLNILKSIDNEYNKIYIKDNYLALYNYNFIYLSLEKDDNFITKIHKNFNNKVLIEEKSFFVDRYNQFMNGNFIKLKNTHLYYNKDILQIGKDIEYKLFKVHNDYICTERKYIDLLQDENNEDYYYNKKIGKIYCYDSYNIFMLNSFVLQEKNNYLI